MQDRLVCSSVPDGEAAAALGVLLSRASVGPAQLEEPGPDGGDLDIILDSGLRAPDHGRLRPWRFMLVRGPARAALGEVLARALEIRDPSATPALLERERGRPLRAPLVIAVGAKVDPEHAVPEIEQLLSVAAATMNLLNAAHALGYGGMWVTGASCYDPLVGEALGFRAPDRLVGFLYLGTPRDSARHVKRPERAAHVREWKSPASQVGTG